jgi:biotin carboxyl carrier protein
MTLLRVSGKKFKLPGDGTKQWTFESRPGGWIIATDSSRNRRRFALNELRGKLSFSTLVSSGFGEIQKESAAAGRGGASAASIEAELTAQFPGKVRKVLVASGAVVTEGEPLLLVEAMKMEFAIKAPASGKVVKILVSEGQQLAPGDRFVDFEVTSNGK